MNKIKPRVILASNNAHKAKEIKEIIGEFFDIITLSEAGLNNFQIIEDGNTFEENAAIKARAVFKETGLPTIADDSGLCVDYLGGNPGIYTSRFAGENATDSENIDKLLNELSGAKKENRKAHFVCVIAFMESADKISYFRGECDGYILNERHGENGFGYDPIFYYPELDKSLAELGESEKNKISHRFRALQKFYESVKN